ncbi:type II toxin-antitoxin system PemK/MazF family toxin [Sporosarcina sp. FSL K6-5500]|uniref:type II toxin-antitoxin system PemK/MazF family toxin n=1 Tax=Sporosarcina sp. FSL K6-5500 TaxID=2921558 RepID=UPI0030FADA59
MQIPARGDLVYVNFTPQSGHEQAGTRPGIVLSPKDFNQATGFAVVCPITRQAKGYPFEVALPDGLAIEGVVLTDQVKSLDWRSRQFNVKGQAPQEVVTDCLDLIHTFL